MSNTRIDHTNAKFTDAQIQLAVDYIAENHTFVVHPEDKDLGFFVRYDQIEKKVAALTDNERAARISRETQYVENFKAALRSYFQNSNPWCEGVVSDYAVGNTRMLDAIENTNVGFTGGFWEVTMSHNGKVYHRSGKYGENQEIQPTTNGISNIPKQSM